jgi:hypothetical protein
MKWDIVYIYTKQLSGHRNCTGRSSLVRNYVCNDCLYLLFQTVSLKILKDMFPLIPEADLKSAFQDNLFDIDITIEYLLEKAQG